MTIIAIDILRWFAGTQLLPTSISRELRRQQQGCLAQRFWCTRLTNRQAKYNTAKRTCQELSSKLTIQIIRNGSMRPVPTST